MDNKTIEYYDKNAELYFNSTVNGNMKEMYDIFLNYLPASSLILDVGCGSGRDSKYFLDHGYSVKAIDGSKNLCDMASKYIGKKVDNVDFLSIDYDNLFEGIWACASLLHLSNRDFLDVLKKLIISLKDNGIMYISMKNRTGNEIDSLGRYYSYYNYLGLADIFNSCDLTILDYKKTFSVVSKDEPKYWNSFILKRKRFK